MRLEDHLAKILIPSDRLQARIYELGAQVTSDYGDTRPLLVCVLKGGVMFMSDLSRAMSIPHELDFMAISSYGGKRIASSGVVRIIMDLNASIEQRHVLIVEDIVDTGHTLHYMLDTLKARNPASLKVCTLLNKQERREVDIKLDYIGFEIPNEFVVGYGLDFDELYRNLPYIGVLKPEMYS